MTRFWRTWFLVSAVVALTACHRTGYDKTTYDELHQVIDGSSTRLIGRSLDDASRELSLEGVPWDEGASSSPLTQLRIYHFKGFYLLLSLRQSPTFPTLPLMPKPKETPKKRVEQMWWVADVYPALHIDNVNDQELRMSNYWAGVHQGIRISGQATNQVVPKENPSKLNK